MLAPARDTLHRISRINDQCHVKADHLPSRVTRI